MSIHFKTTIFVAGVAGGIIAGLSSPFASELAGLALALGTVQMGIYILERKREANSLALSLLTALFLFAFFAGIIRVQLVEEKVPYVCSETCSFEGTIVSSPESKDVYQTIVVRPDTSETASYDVQLRASLYPKYEIGERVLISGKATVPDAMFPHGEEKSFDYVSYLHTKNVGSEMMFPKIETVDADAHTIRDMLGRWKEDMVRRMNHYVASPASSLATGMLFGNSSMSKELLQTFRVAGLSHIVVLSGFNIAIVIAFVLLVFAFLPLVFRIVMATVFVLAFVVMVGGEASVVRATVMALVSLLAMVVGRPYVARQALLLSLLAIIMYEPDALLHSVSLHLSFLATAGIVYLSEPLKQIVERYLSRRSVVELLTTTLAAYFATLPYVMHTFGTVSVYALVANALALPFVPIAMLLSFLVVLASYVSETFSLLVGYADTLLINIILFIAHTTERLPFSSINFDISFWAMMFLYILVALGIFLLTKKKQDETLATIENGYLTDIIPY